MTGRLNRDAYQRLIDDDLQWLHRQPRTLARDHIAVVLRQSADALYTSSRDGMGSNSVRFVETPDQVTGAPLYHFVGITEEPATPQPSTCAVCDGHGEVHHGSCSIPECDHLDPCHACAWTPRPAEDVARELIVPTNEAWADLRDETGIVPICISLRGAESIQLFTARLIERSRAEGAAEERLAVVKFIDRLSSIEAGAIGSVLGEVSQRIADGEHMEPDR